VGTRGPSYSMGKVAMYLAKRVGSWGTTAITQFWNGRDHSTNR